MEDYPRTLAEFEARFATEEACRAYLAKLRWPTGFICPRCGHTRAWPVRTVLWQCASCGHQTSVTAGTIFDGTRAPLTTWFRAMWYVTSQKTGTSALSLPQVLGLRSYQTAWAWLHKLRRAMVRPGRDRLAGQVEVDETLVGRLGGARGRSTATKALVVVAAEEVGRGIGRIRMARIPDGSAETLEAFVAEAIEPGSGVHTDGWHGYTHLEAHGYHHRVTHLRGDHALIPVKASSLGRVDDVVIVCGSDEIARLGGQEMFVPLAHPPGDAQADFGEALVVIAKVVVPPAETASLRPRRRSATVIWDRRQWQQRRPSPNIASPVLSIIRCSRLTRGGRRSVTSRC